jgi:hypothetical protein
MTQIQVDKLTEQSQGREGWEEWHGFAYCGRFCVLACHRHHSSVAKHVCAAAILRTQVTHLADTRCMGSTRCFHMWCPASQMWTNRPAPRLCVMRWGIFSAGMRIRSPLSRCQTGARYTLISPPSPNVLARIQPEATSPNAFGAALRRLDHPPDMS